MERESIEDFVSESDAGKGILREVLEIAGEMEFFGEGGEALLLGFSE